MNPAYYNKSDGNGNKSHIFSSSRVIFDNFFNFLLVILAVELISGIIIDKFGDLREKDSFINHDQKNICFVCGRNKETIERLYMSRAGYRQHIYFDHNMWDYIFFIAYLKEKK